MNKSLRILILITSGIIFTISINSMEIPKENIVEKSHDYGQQHELHYDPEGKLHSMKKDDEVFARINTTQLPEAKTEVMIKRKMLGSTVLEQVTFNAMNEFSLEAEKIDTKYFNGELKSRIKEETLDSIK